MLFPISKLQIRLNPNLDTNISLLILLLLNAQPNKLQHDASIIYVSLVNYYYSYVLISGEQYI
jgi:hypothetical protein